ncbi:unnamed protein product, partial [Rotaria sordida]
MDIKLLQTFKNINTRTAMRVHDTSKGLVPASSTSAIQKSSSENNVRSQQRIGSISELVAANLPEQTIPDLMFFENNRGEHQGDDAQMHHFLDSNLPHARRR